MPELPEVQSTVDYLSPRLEGRIIEKCRILWPGSIATHSTSAFRKLLLGRRILKVNRRGKFIVIYLASAKGESALLVHLRMSGTLEVISASLTADQHDRVLIGLDNGKELRFNDVRKFGKMYFSSCPSDFLQKLGVEPLEAEFSADKLFSILNKRKGAIKPLLLNQKLIAGIGNIYADESLWLAKIHPQSAACSVSFKESRLLHAAIIKILREAILLKGTDNGDQVVEGGLYRPKVYGRMDKPCPRCRKPIVRIVVGQRGTHFCKSCQKVRL